MPVVGGRRTVACMGGRWRAGHAHAAALLLLALVVLRYVDKAALAPRLKAATRHAFPLAAILLPIGSFL